MACHLSRPCFSPPPSHVPWRCPRTRPGCSAGNREMGWQDSQLELGVCLPFGLRSESLSRPSIFGSRLCFLGGLHFLVLFCSAWHSRFLHRDLCWGRKILRELCPREVTIWPIFILQLGIPKPSFGTDAGPDQHAEVTAVTNQHATQCH